MMKNSTNLEENIEGFDKFWAWKWRVLHIFEEHELENYVKEEVADPEGDKDKAKHMKNWSNPRG